MAALGEKYRGGGHKAATDKPIQFSERCGKCGAERTDKQIGLEPTLGEHIETLVKVFDEVRRVLRKDGVLWVNYGDCYATSPAGNNGITTSERWNPPKASNLTYGGNKPFSTIRGTLKPKDLCLIPFRLAIALQDAGWWVRSDIIWHKPNPMPESIKDRPVSAHEYVFMLTKSARYWYDAEAVKIPVTGNAHARRKDGKRPAAKWATKNDSRIGTWKETYVPETANLRNVWTIPTAPFSEAHFATFPPKLVETCIKAGCPEGGTVLDCFAGAGTTGLVADRLGRNAVLVELNPEYCEMARNRIHGDAPLFVDIDAPDARSEAAK